MTGTLQSLLAEFDPELPLEQAKTIPNTWYTSPEVARLEREAVFARSWQMVGRREQVAAPGAFLTANIDGEPLVIVRGEDGTLRAFFNVCRHKAGPLCTKNAARSRSSAAATTAGPTTSRATFAGCPSSTACRTSRRRTTASSRSRSRSGGRSSGCIWTKPSEPRREVPGSVAGVGRIAKGARRVEVVRPRRATTSRATGRCTSITTSTAATT